MAAAYRVVVSSVSCYNSVVVDRRTHSHAVHYCPGPCGALSQGLDCTVAHRGTCSEVLAAPDTVYTDANSSLIHSHNLITQHLHNHGKVTVTLDRSYNGGLERADSSGSLSLGEDSPTWRGKKAPIAGGSTGNLSSSGSLKDITEEAINLASGKLKEFSFDKLRLSSSSHVTLRKGRKVRPDSLSRRSTDLEIIYGHFSSNVTANGTANGMTNGTGLSNDENLPPFVPGKVASLEETKLKGSTATLSAITKLSAGSTGSQLSIGSLDQSLNTMASLYRNTLGDENLIARLLEKTRAEAGTGGAGGEDIRACLDILLKCSEDLKKCTDIIKQCIRHKAGGGPEDGGASPDSVYRAVMTRLSSYLKRLPLELEGVGSLGGVGQGGPVAAGSGHSDLAELVSTLHSIQQGVYSPIFGNEQPPRYEDVVTSPPLPKTPPHSVSSALSSVSSLSSLKSDSIHTKPVQSPPSRATPHTNGLQNQHLSSVTQQTLSPPSVTCSPGGFPPTHSPSRCRTSPTPLYTHTPPASSMEALHIEEEEEEEEADVGKTPEQISQQAHTPTRVMGATQNKNGITFGEHTHLSHAHSLRNSSNALPGSTDYSPTWPSSASLTVPAPKAVSHRNDDIDKLLMDLESLSQSMSHPRNTEPPLPAKTRKREAGQGITSGEALCQPKLSQFQVQKPANHIAMNGPTTRSPQSPTPPRGEKSEAVLGEEEDGALLLRILESIESFAQELVDTGAGSTGSAERNSGKEREVMRLLQDTMATACRADTPVESTSPPAAPIGPSVHTHAPTQIPAIPPKHFLANTPAVSPAPTPTYINACDATSHALPKPKPEASLKLMPTAILEPTTEAADSVAEASTGETDTTSLPALVMAAPASSHSSTHQAEPTPVAAPEAPAPIEIPVVVVSTDAVVALDDAVAVRDTASTLLIQQTPEVIRVQSKPERTPGTPPLAPTLPTPSPTPTPTSTPTPRSPSPPPAPVVVTPPPPAINIPRFYYPRGLPAVGPPTNHDAAIAAIEAAFGEFEEEKADIYEMGKIAKACGCPLYWKAPMFSSAGGERTGFVSVHSFIATWRKLLHSCHDDASRFISLLAKPSCNYLEQEDLIPLLQDIVDTHPGLTFLKDAPEFHSRYITTVIQRIFYVVNRSWTGRMTMMELRRSNFLQTLALLEEEDDINQITDYFSYEHFYVIYCKFWELDTDHDLYIDPKDLGRYNDHASSNRIIGRLFSGAVTRGNAVQREGRMSYAEFVWFLMSEEDKKNPTSIEYWFRCMDVDGDGVLSMFELEYFYEEQCERMERMGIEPLPFQDLLCQMLDLVKPESSGKITLGDLKHCRMAHIFFDTFFNLEKYLDHEQRDPFAVQKDIDSEGPEPSDWDKYASEEYEILVAEETANEQLHDGSFDDDYESEELQVPGDMGNKVEKLVISDLSA